jgi:lipase
MDLRQFDIAVDGGNLRVLLWGDPDPGNRVAVAVHGISGSAMSWGAVARQMPPGWTLATPDLRGRGHSNGLPGPYGLDQHVADVAAVLSYFAQGGPPVLAGHSMGAFVALLTQDSHPGLTSKTVLVDGGLPLPFALPDATDLDAVLDASLGPAIARLTQVFPDETAYLDFWRAHPALGPHWTPDVTAYVRYDLQPTADGAGLRSRPVEDAVRTDGRDLLLLAKRIGDALERLPGPTRLFTAPMGMFGQPPGIQPPELVETWQARAPMLRPQLVPDVNHYTILFDPGATATVAAAITT